MSGIALLASKATGLALAELLVARGFPLLGIMTVDDRADGRSRHAELETFAVRAGVPFVSDHSADAVVHHVAGWGAHVALVAGWYRLIPVERLPDVGFFGFHGSMLPRYRGGSPLVWQIIAGEPEIGLSMFRLASGIDDGDLVAQRSRPLGPDETIADVLDWVRASCLELTERHAGELLSGAAILQAQDHAQATYCAVRYPADGRIDWVAPARRVHDFIRAQTAPYPGAFSLLEDGRTVRIWRTRLESRPWLGVCGGVADILPDGPVVTCGEGAVVITDAEVDGEPRRPVLELLGSRRLRLR